MSRNYEMSVKVVGYNLKRDEAIEDAIVNEWDFESFEHYKNREGKMEMTSFAQGQLCGGETEQEFADRLAKAILKANGKPCYIEIGQTCLEDLPVETYFYDKEEYKALVGKAKSKRK